MRQPALVNDLGITAATLVNLVVAGSNPCHRIIMTVPTITNTLFLNQTGGGHIGLEKPPNTGNFDRYLSPPKTQTAGYVETVAENPQVEISPPSHSSILEITALVVTLMVFLSYLDSRLRQ